MSRVLLNANLYPDLENEIVIIESGVPSPAICLRIRRPMVPADMDLVEEAMGQGNVFDRRSKYMATIILPVTAGLIRRQRQVGGLDTVIELLETGNVPRGGAQRLDRWVVVTTEDKILPVHLTVGTEHEPAELASKRDKILRRFRSVQQKAKD